MRHIFLKSSHLFKLLILITTYPLTATALTVTEINNLPPGAIINKAAKDVLDNLSDGSSTSSATVTCSQNPYLPNTIPCKPAQSVCPINSEVIKTDCPVTNTTANTSLINSIFGGTIYLNFNSSIDKATNTLNCSFNQYVPSGPSNPNDSQKVGYSPYCYYIGSNNKKGVPSYYDSFNQVYNFKAANDNFGSTIFTVTPSSYNKPSNWKCIPVTLKAKALCATIPTNVNTLLQKLGKIK